MMLTFQTLLGPAFIFVRILSVDKDPEQTCAAGGPMAECGAAVDAVLARE